MNKMDCPELTLIMNVFLKLKQVSSGEIKREEAKIDIKEMATALSKMEHDEKYAEISISISNSFTDDIVLNNIFDLSDEQMKKMCDEIIPTFNDEFAQLSEVTNDVFGVLFGVTPVEFDNDVTNISNELLN
jgi:hypothetical protein